MFLSQLHIDWRKAKNPYELHRAIWELFPGRPDDQRDFLFRVEALEANKGARVLMLSQHFIEEQSEHCRLLATREWNPVFAEGQRLRFRLRANPVKSIKDESKGMRTSKQGFQYAKRVRVPLIHDDQQQAWLERKLHDIADIEQLVIQQEFPLRFRKNTQDKTSPMAGKIQPVLFDGVLLARSPGQLVELISKGIGPAKSFGCGLLSLANE
jgi:CRISPR system Cascade subunit CasE